MGSANELFLLAANLAITLMSVTVPTYAISVTYLAKETSATIEEPERSRQELSRKTREQNVEGSPKFEKLVHNLSHLRSAITIPIYVLRIDT